MKPTEQYDNAISVEHRSYCMTVAMGVLVMIVSVVAAFLEWKKGNVRSLIVMVFVFLLLVLLLVYTFSSHASALHRISDEQDYGKAMKRGGREDAWQARYVVARLQAVHQENPDTPVAAIIGEGINVIADDTGMGTGVRSLAAGISLIRSMGGVEPTPDMEDTLVRDMTRINALIPAWRGTQDARSLGFKDLSTDGIREQLVKDYTARHRQDITLPLTSKFETAGYYDTEYCRLALGNQHTTQTVGNVKKHFTDTPTE